MEYLLDTNVLIDFFSEGAGQPYIEEQLASPQNTLSTAWIAAAEFLVKATRDDAKKLFEVFDAGDLELHELTGTAALLLLGDIRRKTSLPMPDCMILATAKSEGITLLTRDVHLFRSGKKVYPDIVCITEQGHRPYPTPPGEKPLRVKEAHGTGYAILDF